MPQVRVELKPDVAELDRLVTAIEAFADRNGLDAATAGRLTLALDEVVTNAITHGGLPEEAVIGVDLRLDGGEVVATVSDPGPAFDPLGDAPDADTSSHLEDRRLGGLGLLIVKNLARDLGYAREGARNRLTMRFSAG